MALASYSGYDKLMRGCDDSRRLQKPYTLDYNQPLSVPMFELPPDQHPKKFVETVFSPTAEGACKLAMLHGTTTLAFIYEPATPQDKGGIVVAADSRASSGTYISTSSVMKILEVSDHIVATMAGGAADCQFWVRMLAKQARLFELQNKQKITVSAASKLLANMLYNYRGMGLSVGSMVAGYDKTGPNLYFCDNDGTRIPGKLFSCGSGSLNAYGVLDRFHKKKMTDKDAIDLGRKAIMHATHRDTGSGGWANLYHITVKGHEYQGKLDVSEMFYEQNRQLKRDTFDPKDLE